MKLFELKLRRIAPLVVLGSFVCFCCMTPAAQAATTGGRLTVSGTINGTTAVNFSLLDSQIHSGAGRISLCDGIFTDAYVLQGGSPNGCDNGDSFETTQAPGNADVSGFHIKTFYQFNGCNTKGNICASPDTGFATVTNNTGFAFTGTITLGGTSPATGAVSDSWTSGLAAGSSVTLALSIESSNDGGFNSGDQCSAPTVGIGTGAVGTATGSATCGILITVTQVDGSGNALAYSVAPSNPPGNNGNPYDSSEDTLVGIQNNSGATLNSMVLASSDTSFGGLLAFDGDGPCNTLFHSPAYPWCSTPGFTGYEGPDNTFSNIMSTSCPIFGTCATSGTVNFTSGIPNGGSTWLALEASSATPPTMQVQTSPPQNFNSSTTNTTVPFIFSPTPGKYEQHNEIFPKGGNITCPIGCADGQLQVQDTKTPISNAMWPLYVGGTPWGPSKLFPVASNGGTDQGSMYTIQCFDNTHPPVPGQCPFPTNPGPGNHVSARLIFDLPAGVQPPAISPGTTVAAIHYPPINPPWAPSNTLPNALCRNAMLATSTSPDPVDCPGENTLTDKYGSTNSPLSNTRNGSYALVHDVPMLCSAWKVNGMQVHNGCVQDNSTFFVRSPLTFDFLVTPAQLPAGFTIKNIASIQRTSGTVTVTTTSNLPATWTNGTTKTLAIKPDDKANFPAISAVISNVTTNSFQYTQTGSDATDNPATGTVDDANGWVAAPVNKLFYTFDPFPGPDYPNIVLVQNDENLNDLDNCFAGSSNCPVAGTSPAQPGTSSTQSVEFATTTPLPVPADGLYDLHVSEADTARNRGMNIQLLTDLSATCPNPSPSDANTPAGGWTPPCYKTALWFAEIGVDNTAPTVSTPVLTPPPVNGTYAVGQSVTASVNCVDVISGGVASGVVMCGKDSFTPAPTPPAGTQTSVNSSGNPVPTSTRGKQTFTLSAKDQAGNVGTSPGASFCVGYTITSVDRNGVVGFTQPVDNPGPGLHAVVNMVGSSQAIPLSLTVVDCNGNPVSNLDLLGSTNVGTVKTVVLSATNAPSGTCATAVADNSISTAAAGSSGWQILGNGVYDYNWKPMAPVGSCLAFSVNLGDNTPHTAYFNVVRK